MFASPFYMSADPRPNRPTSIPAASRALLLNREIIAVQQDVLGRQGRRVLKTAGGLQLWRRELEGGAVAVAVHNELDEPTAALDKRSDQLFADLVHGHLARGGMAIAATHQPLGLDTIRSLELSGNHRAASASGESWT